MNKQWWWWFMHTYIYAYMHYITLMYVITYIALHDITLRYITLHYITLYCITLHYITLYDIKPDTVPLFTYIRIHIHIICIHIFTYILTHIHTYIHAFIHIMHTHVCTCIRSATDIYKIRKTREHKKQKPYLFSCSKWDSIPTFKGIQQRALRVGEIATCSEALNRRFARTLLLDESPSELTHVSP